MNQYYAIKAPDGEYMISTFSKTKKDTKELCSYILSYDWKLDYRAGYRCVKVEIREI